MKTSVDVHQFLLGQGIEHEIIPIDTPLKSVEQAAVVLGLKKEELVKSVVCLADKNPLLVIVSGNKRVDCQKLLKHLGCKEASLADREQVIAWTGYLLGATPPLAHQTKLKTFIDCGVLEVEVIYTGAGEINTVLKMRSKDLPRATEGQVVDVACEEIG